MRSPWTRAIGPGPSRAGLGLGPLEPLLAGLGGLGLAIAMTWPLALNVGSDIGKDLGDPLLQAWQVAWVGHALLHQPLHLFQSNAFWPLPDSLAFSDALVGYAPAGTVGQQGPHAALVVYNLLFLFAYALAFLGAYLLARELGADRWGAIAAGIAFAYAPWKLAQNGHLAVISSGGIPLALVLLARGYRRRRPGAVVAGWAVAAWQMTLGFTLGLQLAYLLAALALVVTAFLVRSRAFHGLSKELVVASVVGLCLFGLVTFLQARPYLRVIDAHPEAERTPAHVASFSPSLTGFLAAPGESWLWGEPTSAVRAGHALGPEQTLFPGATPVLLAVAGVFSFAYPRRLRLGIAIGVAVCAILSLGLRDVSGLEKYLTPYRFLYDFAPGWDGVRTPGRITALTSLGLALLAGAGVCLILRHVRRLFTARRAHARLAGSLAGAVLVGAILAEGAGPLAHPHVPPAPPGQSAAMAPQLHLPLDFDKGSRYSYWSIQGFPAIVNGSGAFEPDILVRLRAAVASFPDRDSVTALRELGVRTVVLHPDLAVGTAWQDAVQRPTSGLSVTRKVAAGVVLYELTPSSGTSRSA